MNAFSPRLAALLLPAVFALTACSAPPDLNLIEENAMTLRERIRSGELTSTELTTAYLQRIAQIDTRSLHAILEINPDALAIAAELDAHYRANGPVGPLHGLPVILKANIDTGDAMATSAGSIALAHHIAATDAFVVTRLREAGAVILGKANMSEWANFRSTASTSGWSSLGGQVHNPYVLDRNPCGSSSGSAVAVAASLTALSVGTETDGSIVCPAGLNGIVGIKPTLGAVSRRGLIPVAHSQDTAGPMAKTVMGAALLLQAMVAHDAADAGATRFPTDSASLLPDPTQTSLRGKRVGVLRGLAGENNFPRIKAVFDASIEALRELGAKIIDPIEIERDPNVATAEFQVMLSEFKADLNDYLESHEIAEDRDTLAELIEFNQRHEETVMPIFGQDILHAAEATSGLADPDYHDALAGSRARVRETLIAIFAEHNLDALLAPTNAPAWKTDWIAGDRFLVGSSALAAISGYPSVTVPAGEISGLPLGVSFVGLAGSDASLIQMAYAFEQATLARFEPTYIPTLED